MSWLKAQQFNELPFLLPPVLFPGDRCELHIRISNPWWSDAQLSLTGAELKSCSVEPQRLPGAEYDNDCPPELSEEATPLSPHQEEVPDITTPEPSRGAPRPGGPLRLTPGAVSLLNLRLDEAQSPSAILKVLLQSGPNRTLLQHELLVRRGRIGRLQCQPVLPTLEQRVSQALEHMYQQAGKGSPAGIRLLEESLQRIAQLRQPDGGWGWLPATHTDVELTARFVLLLSIPPTPTVLQGLRVEVLRPAAHYLEEQLSKLSPFSDAELMAQLMAALGAFKRLFGPVQSTPAESRSMAMLFSRAPKGSVLLQALLALAAWYHQEQSIAEQVLRWMPPPDISPVGLRAALLQLLALTLVLPRAESTQSIRIRMLSLEEDERLLGAEIGALQKVNRTLAPLWTGEGPLQTSKPYPAVTARTEGTLLKVLLDSSATQGVVFQDAATTRAEPLPLSSGDLLVTTVHIFVPESLERVMLAITPAAGLSPEREAVDSHLLELPLADLGETWTSLWQNRAEISVNLLEDHFSRIPADLDVVHTARWVPVLSRWEDGRLVMAIPKLPLGLWRVKLRFRACWAGVFQMPPAVLWSEVLPWMEVISESALLRIHPATPASRHSAP